MSKQNRIDELDIMKGIAILAVMHVHIAPDFRLVIPGITFHLSTFFCVTGILLYRKEVKSLKVEIKSKAISLLIPYILLSIIYIIVWGIYWLLFNQEEAAKLIVKSFYLAFSGMGIGTLWFLPTLFGSCLLFLNVKNYGHKHGRLLLALLLIPELFVCQVLNNHGMIGCLHKSVVGLFFNEMCLVFQILIAASLMALGTFLWEIFDCLKTARYSFVYIALITVLSELTNLLFFELYSGNDLHLARITSTVGYLICVPAGTVFVMGLSIIINRIGFFKQVFTYLGKNSLVIMTTHKEYKIVEVSQYLIGTFWGAIVLRKILTFQLLCLIELVICMVVNKSFLKRIFNWRMIKSETDNS